MDLRTTDKPKKIPRPNNFDLIRLSAAIQVIVGHVRAHLKIESPAIESIWEVLDYFPGVTIFFVVSGFLISGAFEANPNISDYSWNRSLRIFPALWVCLFFSVASFLCCGFCPDTTLIEFACWLLCQVSCIQFHNPDFMRDYGVGVLNGSLWTIPVEIQFYCIIPFIYVSFGLLKSKRNSLLLFLILIFIIMRTFVFSLDHGIVLKLFRVSFVPYLYVFLIGVFVQRNFFKLKGVLVNCGAYWLGIYIFITLFFTSLGYPCGGNDANVFSVTTLSFLTISTAFTLPNLSLRLLRNNDVSYGIYIYHMPIANMFVHLDYVRSLRYFVAVVFLSLSMALISWRFVEKPTLLWKRRSSQKH